MKRSQSILKRRLLSITEKINVFRSLQTPFHQRVHREKQTVLMWKIKVILNPRFKRLPEELQSKILQLILSKNLRSDTKNRIDRLLVKSQKILKHSKTMKNNPEQKNILQSPLKKMNPRLGRHTREAVFMKNIKNLKNLKKM